MSRHRPGCPARGDEFVLLLALDPVATAAMVVQRMSDVLREPFEVGGVRLEIETSAGVALLPDQGTDLETLLHRADVAMYEAKARAEAIVVFERDLERRTPVRSALVSEPARVFATLTALRELGVGLGLDDCGTGHASLTRLKRLPVDELDRWRQEQALLLPRIGSAADGR